MEKNAITCQYNKKFTKNSKQIRGECGDYKPKNPFYANKSRTIEYVDQSVEWSSHKTSRVRYFGQLARDNATLYDIIPEDDTYHNTWTPLIVNFNLTFVRGLLVDFRYNFIIFYKNIHQLKC